ncbi:unnamed protein product, partial [Enterobius vermicularis]|uniref:EGF-like domain-containing protein n=1 Tax=Enterobius vermicularis TaxID=51028 RepID=A0A0N4VCR1_ENTVE
FYNSLFKTENQHFAGGNTEWEERKLGKFAKSETRLVEILESLCKLNVLNNREGYSGVKDIEFKCQELAEEHEETLENWYFHKQNSDPDLLHWLCFDRLELCCLPGHFGKDCKACPGVDRNFTACSGHGECDGDGSREGTGKCQCNRGYVGFMCSNCDADYYPVAGKCHRSCRGGCVSEGPKGCKECRKGWISDEEKGCVDVDECLEGNKCLGEQEVCVNNEGSYSCECKEGYARDHKEKVCKIDVNANDPWIRPDIFLRSVSFTALFVLISLVVWLRSISLAVFAGFCLCLILYIELWLDTDSFFDALR